MGLVDSTARDVEAVIPMISQPVFLVGAERSGTTLLRLMLDGHPELAWNEEFEYAVDLMPADEGYPDLGPYHAYLEEDRIFRLSGFVIDKQRSYPELLDSFLEQKKSKDNKRLVGATVHRHFDRLLRIWPDARFVHVLRDGRDVARSVIEMGWAGNLWTGCERWIEAENLWENVKGNITADRHVTVLFEHLIQDPVRELTRICEFCGVEYHPVMLDYPKYSTYKPVDPKRVTSWRSCLSESEIQLVESRMGAMLVERNYELSNLRSVTITSRMEMRLRRQDYWSRLQFRLRRYGLGLVLLEYLARRLKMSMWHRRVKFRLDAIANSYLK
jgi:hypothetical protein